MPIRIGKLNQTYIGNIPPTFLNRNGWPEQMVMRALEFKVNVIKEADANPVSGILKPEILKYGLYGNAFVRRIMSNNYALHQITLGFNLPLNCQFSDNGILVIKFKERCMILVFIIG